MLLSFNYSTTWWPFDVTSVLHDGDLNVDVINVEKFLWTDSNDFVSLGKSFLMSGALKILPR